jgi:hypothetical protein
VLDTWNQNHSEINQTAFIQSDPWALSTFQILAISHIVLPAFHNLVHLAHSAASTTIFPQLVSDNVAILHHRFLAIVLSPGAQCVAALEKAFHNLVFDFLNNL